ncbi:MAG: DUF4417 domain-containing protein [Methylococcales bacterium]
MGPAPYAALRHIRQYFAALTPDFSMLASGPTVVQMWNIYRSQWTGRGWQEHGIRVIPTVNYSDEESFEYCFAGIPQYQIASIAVPHMRKPIVKRRFIQGFREMEKRLRPKAILCYGLLPIATKLPIIVTPPD